MSHALAQLHEFVVLLDQVDGGALPLPPAHYQALARATRRLVVRNFSGTSIAAFADALDPLRVTAENVFFDAHGRFADLDGSDHADRAHASCEALTQRLRRPVVR